MIPKGSKKGKAAKTIQTNTSAEEIITKDLGADCALLDITPPFVENHAKFFEVQALTELRHLQSSAQRSQRRN